MAPGARGTVTVERLSDALAQPPAGPDDLGPVRVRVQAIDATLGEVAVALGEAVPVAVVVDPRIARIRIHAFLPDVSLDDLGRLLRQGYGADAVFREGVVRIARHRGPTPEPGPIEVRLLPIDGPATPAQVAAAYCATVATPRGSAAVLGHSVVLRDVADALDLGERMVRGTGYDLPTPRDHGTGGETRPNTRVGPRRP